MKENLIKIPDACKDLNVTRQTLYNWHNNGVINFVKSPSGGIFVCIDELYQNIKDFCDKYTVVK